MIADLNKQIQLVEYNFLNLLQKVTTDLHAIDYDYDAAGTKLRKKVVQGNNTTTTDYIGGIHYINGSIDFIQTAEGRADRASDGTYTYSYFISDHLGNNRVTINTAGIITQVNDYYPFGLTFNDYPEGQENLYTYTGKEEQKETGWVDFGARMYQPELGRWFNVDPKSYKYFSWSPYNYVFNSPLMFVDPDGREVALGPNYKKNGERMKVGDDGLDKGQRRTLKKMQRLTNDQLTADSKTGLVSISQKGGANSKKNLSYGTNLVENVINTKKTITVTERVSGNVTTGNSSPDASNGNGADSHIYLDNGSITGGLDEKGSRSRSEFIGLGHELIHGLRIAQGKINDFSLKGILVDPDGEAQEGETLKVSKTAPITIEENRARREENKLRKENKITLRKMPY